GLQNDPGSLIRREKTWNLRNMLPNVTPQVSRAKFRRINELPLFPYATKKPRERGYVRGSDPGWHSSGFRSLAGIARFCALAMQPLEAVAVLLGSLVLRHEVVLTPVVIGAARFEFLEDALAVGAVDHEQVALRGGD